MTVQSSTTRSDATGNGVTTAFAVPFYFLDNTHLQIIRTQISTGVATTLALTTDYTVTGAGVGSGGTATMLVAPTTDQRLSILRNVPFTQLAHYVPNDPFPAATHEQIVDQLTMEVQQINEAVDRSLTLPPNTTGVSTELPVPEANKLIGWNPTADALQNIDTSTLATIVAYGTASGDIFSGDGTTTVFTLGANPGALYNLDVSIGGVDQRPVLDYNWSAGTDLTFVVAPVAGTDNISVKYKQALPQGTADSAAVTYQPAGAGAFATDVQTKLRESVSIHDFCADATGASSASAAIATALAEADTVEFIGGTYLLDANLQLASGKRLIGRDGATFRRNTDVRLIGSSASLTSLTAAAAMDYGSTRITLDASSYAAVAVGDYLYVKDKTSVNVDYIQDYAAASGADLNDPSKWIYQVQTFKIVEKLSSNIVRVNAAAHVNFPLTTTGAIYKVSSTIEDVVIDGITFENGLGLSGASAEAAFINTDYVYGLTVKNCRFNLGGYTGGIYMDFGQANILNNVFDMPVQLAVFLRQNVANSVVSGNTFRNQMSGDASIFVEAHNYNVTIANNTFDGGRSQELANAAQLISAVQIEARATNCSVTGNVINGYGVGVRMDLGAINNTVSNNTISNADICGIRLSTSPLNTVTGNTFYNCGISATPGTLADVVGAYINIGSDNCIFEGNIVSADSAKAKPAFYTSGNRGLIANNVFKNTNGYTLANTNNRITGNTGDSDFVTQESFGEDVVRATKTATITDNVATTVLTITTPNPSGSNDGGCYACRIHLVASYGAGGAATASKGQFVMFTVANAASGTQDVSTVSTVATTSRADPGGFTDLTDPVVTLVQTSSYVVDVQVQSDGLGVVGAGKITAAVELVWTGYTTPPVVS